MLKAVTKIHKNTIGKTMYIVVPVSMVYDDKFPFNRDGQPVDIEIKDGKLVISSTVS